jgi:putative hydrolase of the HAD superfamily
LTVKLNWFERGGFVNVWDSIIPSWEVGINKPHPEIYNLALQQVGVRPDQAIFVGHKAYELEGARSVGMKTVAFNYDEDAKADFYIENFAELLAVPFLREQEQELLYGK